MAMKAYACPRCLTIASETEDGDGGPHTCTPTPLVRGLEARIAELESKNEPSIDGPRSGGIPTIHDISVRLLVLSQVMAELASDMEYVGGFGVIAAHGIELAGAAAIAETWAVGISEAKESLKISQLF